MKIIDMTQGRKTYEVELKVSPLWECALGLAAATYPDILPTLEKPAAYWTKARAMLSPSMLYELDYMQEHNTWKTLLHLLHEKDFNDIRSFINYMTNLNEKALRYQSLPFLGVERQSVREDAVGGDEQAINTLIQSSQGHASHFFPKYIEYICRVEIEELRKHLTRIIGEWYEKVVEPELESIKGMLERDYAEKVKMLPQLSPEQFVEWATGGITYHPEPTVTKVLLIPQCIYRPWNIRAEDEGTKIFYYPIADESMNETIDLYQPSSILVQRYKALGDETRLRLVKLLFQKDRSLQEMTEKLDLAKSTIHHHLTMLRSAKLVTTDGTVYTLRKDGLLIMDKELHQFLERNK